VSIDPTIEAQTITTDREADPGNADNGSSRRWLFGGLGTAAAAAVLAACSSSKKTSTTPTSAGSATTAAQAGGDAKIAALAASLEVLAVDTYKAALTAATAGKLGTVPAAVATFVQTAMGQHQQALDAWNSVLKAAGQPTVSTPPASLKATVDQQFALVKDATGAAKLALLLEQTAADTYLGAISSLTSKEAITMAGALQIVDQEHAAILLFVLGMYPVPKVFQTTEKAFKG